MWDDSDRRVWNGKVGRNATCRWSVRCQAIKNNSTKPNLNMVHVEEGVPVGGTDVKRRDDGSDVTWRGQLSGEDCTATNRCSRRDE